MRYQEDRGRLPRYRTASQRCWHSVRGRVRAAETAAICDEDGEINNAPSLFLRQKQTPESICPELAVGQPAETVSGVHSKVLYS